MYKKAEQVEEIRKWIMYLSQLRLTLKIPVKKNQKEVTGMKRRTGERKKEIQESRRGCGNKKEMRPCISLSPFLFSKYAFKRR